MKKDDYQNLVEKSIKDFLYIIQDKRILEQLRNKQDNSLYRVLLECFSLNKARKQATDDEKKTIIEELFQQRIIEAKRLIDIEFGDSVLTEIFSTQS